jgi:hypothetical protein
MARRPVRAEVVTIYWRDIPVQVNGQFGRERHQVLLSERFQRAVDRAKNKARIRTASDDVAQWRREATPCDGDLATAADAAAAALESRYSPDLLGQLAYAGGFLTALDDAHIEKIDDGVEP